MRFKSVVVRRSTYEGTKQAKVILRAARTVFVRDGASAFSARRVAREARLSLGSLQHVFPTAESLLLGMLEDVITSYDEAYQRMLAKLPFDPAARWQAVVGYLIDDIFDAGTRGIFFGFWSSSCSNPLAAKLLREAYAYHRDNISRFISEVRPDLDRRGCEILAMQVIALIDGSMIFTAPRSNFLPRRALTSALKSSISRLISDAMPAVPRPLVRVAGT